MAALGFWFTATAAPIAVDKTGFSFELNPGVTLGRYDNELYDDNGERVSRLRWSDLKIAETQLGVRFDQPGFFVQLQGAWGSSFGGSLDDEDYLTASQAADPGGALDPSLSGLIPPVDPGTKFSDTTSKLRNGSQAGSVRRFSADLGFLRLYPRPDLSISLTAGYFFSEMQYRAFGLSGVFGLPPDFATPYAVENSSTEVIRHDVTTYGPRFGFEAKWEVNPQWRLDAKLVYMPWMHYRLEDSHFLRVGTDIGRTPNFLDETSKAQGLEAGVKVYYAINTHWSASLGLDVRGFSTGRIPSFFRDGATNEFVRSGTSKSSGWSGTLSLGAAYSF